MHSRTHSSWEVSNFGLRRKILRDFGHVPTVHLANTCIAYNLLNLFTVEGKIIKFITVLI